MSKPRFEQIADGISVLRVPCGSVATNIFLVGDKDVGWALIDSAHCAQAVDLFRLSRTPVFRPTISPSCSARIRTETM